MYIFDSVRRGITPEVNAIASMVLAVTVVALSVVGLVLWRQSRQRGSALPRP